MSGPLLIRHRPAGTDGPADPGGPVYLPEAELRWRFSRSSGPGGQHVNTSDTQVELSFDVSATTALPEVWKDRVRDRLAGRLRDGVLTVRAARHRSQWRNREEAAQRMAAVLAQATAPPPRARRPKRVTRSANERRLQHKKHRGAVKRGRGTGPDWD